MKYRKILATVICLFLLGLSAAACSIPSAPAATTVPSSTPTVMPSDTPIPTIEPSATPEPTSPSAQVINSTNLVNLSSSAPLRLPGFVSQMVWPSSDLLLGLMEANAFLPVTIDSPAIEASFPIPAAGLFQDASPNGDSFAVVQENNKLGIYGMEGSLIQELDVTSPYFVDYSQDGNWLAVGLPESMTVWVYSTTDWSKTAELTGFETAAPVYRASVAPGGRTLAWMARAVVQFQDIANDQMGPRLLFEYFLLDSAFSPDGTLLALNWGGAIEVISVPDGESIHKTILSEPARSLTFSPDGKLLAAAYKQSIQMWDTATWALLPPIPDEPPTLYLSFSPDGTRLVTIDENQDLRVWSVN